MLALLAVILAVLCAVAVGEAAYIAAASRDRIRENGDCGLLAQRADPGTLVTEDKFREEGKS